MRFLATSTLFSFLSLACAYAPAYGKNGGPMAAPAFAGQSGSDVPAIPGQRENLRQAADKTRDQVKLYQGYIEERIAEIRRLDTNLRAQNREPEIHNLFEEFTRLCNELEDNLDSYEQEHTDMRKALKLIAEKSEKWPAALNEPKPSSEYDFARQTALAAAQSLRADTRQILDKETKYFEAEKKEQR